MSALSFVYPSVLLAGGIVLIQYHAIGFWNQAVGPTTGWAWSVLLEMIALRFWYQPRTRLPALMTTVLVLSGPLYEVTAPIAVELARSASEKASEPRRVALLREAITTEERALQTFLANSEARSGWLPAIEKARQSIAVKQTELQALLTPTGQALPWQQVAIMALQALALVVVQIANIDAITALSEMRETTGTKRKRAKARARPKKGGEQVTPNQPLQ